MNELIIGQRLLIFVAYICGTENSEGSEDMIFQFFFFEAIFYTNLTLTSEYWMRLFNFIFWTKILK